MLPAPKIKFYKDLLEYNIKGKKLIKIELNAGTTENIIKKYNNVKLKLPAIIDNITSKGNTIFISLNNGLTLISIPSISGRWDIEFKLNKRLKISLCFSDDTNIFYLDEFDIKEPCFAIATHKKENNIKQNIGIDLLTEKIEPIDWIDYIKKHVLENPTIKICDLLLNQNIISGIDVIYRSEILYLAEISPHRNISKLTTSEILKLKQAIKIIFRTAYKHDIFNYKIKTLKEFLNPDIFYKIQKGILFTDEKDLDDSDFIGVNLVYDREFDLIKNKVIIESVNDTKIWWVPEVQY